MKHNRDMNRKDGKPFALFCRYARRQSIAILWLTLIYLGATALLIFAPQALSFFIDNATGQVESATLALSEPAAS